MPIRNRNSLIIWQGSKRWLDIEEFNAEGSSIGVKDILSEEWSLRDRRKCYSAMQGTTKGGSRRMQARGGNLYCRYTTNKFMYMYLNANKIIRKYPPTMQLQLQPLSIRYLPIPQPHPLSSLKSTKSGYVIYILQSSSSCLPSPLTPPPNSPSPPY
jgi:hypothetical protein